MSRGGPFSGYHDQPPAGWTTHHQYDWLYPEDDELGVPYWDLITVTGVTGGCVPASAGAWGADTSAPPPEPKEASAPPNLAEGLGGSRAEPQ